MAGYTHRLLQSARPKSFGLAVGLIFSSFYSVACAQQIIATPEIDPPPLAAQLPNIGVRLAAPDHGPFELLDVYTAPGARSDLRWRSPQSYGGFATLAPITVIHGARPGPILCLTGAVHGDELNGIEIVRRVAANTSAEELSGTVIAMPIVNVEGFHRRDRYIGDRSDLNRAFPGSKDGAYAERVAFALFEDVIQWCDMLVDVHTGSFFRENLPQVRGELANDQVAALAAAFGGLAVLDSPAPAGSLRGTAVDAGIPTVVLEVGVSLLLNMGQVATTVSGVRVMMRRAGMLHTENQLADPLPAFFHSEWLRTDYDGILVSGVDLGDRVILGQVVGEIINPLTNEHHEITAPLTGTVLGMAQNQFVSPGFAIMRIGQLRTRQELQTESQIRDSDSEPDSALEQD
jgi:predicted deacylase